MSHCPQVVLGVPAGVRAVPRIPLSRLSVLRSEGKREGAKAGCVALAQRLLATAVAAASTRARCVALVQRQAVSCEITTFVRTGLLCLEAAGPCPAPLPAALCGETGKGPLPQTATRWPASVCLIPPGPWCRGGLLQAARRVPSSGVSTSHSLSARLQVSVNSDPSWGLRMFFGAFSPEKCTL